MTLSILFWLLLLVLMYSYAGYALILRILVGLKRLRQSAENLPDAPSYEPEVTLFVTAWNEKDYVAQKIANSFSLDYPREKVHHIWITDGSDDGTYELLRDQSGIEVHHQPERKGKIDAMNRGIPFIKTPVVIFSDANTRLSRNTIREMVVCFSDPRVGCVAGEKRIIQKDAENASAAGEGLYWKFESRVKKLDAELNSAVGGVGELFAIRTGLYEPVEKDTLLDDFIISLRIAAKGYRIAYTPEAFAEETASLNVREELKRKIRIAAGGVQTMFRLRHLLNPFKYGLLSWQYFSHKVLRWSVAPFFLFLFLPVNIALVTIEESWTKATIPSLVLWIQLICYLFAIAGWFLEHHRFRMKLFFAPYYFVAINYASVRGIFRYFLGNQKVAWEKSKRQD
jgi:cellulose synthase/poly-beta-1,6-N-acetylglucosamine synthase-like glycosyltransferase